MIITKEQAIEAGGSRAEQVIDLLLGKEIRVTKAMIRAGRKRSCYECPVALAVRAALGGEPEVDVDLESITVDGCVSFRTPRHAAPLQARAHPTLRRRTGNPNPLYDSRQTAISQGGRNDHRGT
jgi:hypothetical protein